MASLREMAGAAGGGGEGGGGNPAAGGQRPGAGQRPQPGADGEGGDEDVPADVDIKRIYNENRKLSRLLAKSQQQLQGLSAEIEPLKGVSKQFDAFRSIFSEQGGAGQQGDGEQQPSIYERAEQMHQRALAANPEGGGISLTRDIAKEASEGYALVKEQAQLIKKLQEELEIVKKPAFQAENNTFMQIDNRLRNKVSELFEDEGIAAKNYNDFEQAAIAMMVERRKDPVNGPKWWRRLMFDPQAQDAFLNEVIAQKLPRSYAPRGAAAIPDYDVNQARSDFMRAQTMKAGPERADLKKKSRQAMLQEVFNSVVDMRGGR